MSSSFAGMHTPPFKHGLLIHGFILLQYAPERSAGHEHLIVLIEKYVTDTHTPVPHDSANALQDKPFDNEQNPHVR